MKLILKIFLKFTALCISFVFLQERINAISPEIVLRNSQLLTPILQEEQRYIIPQNFSHTNNLRRKVGSPFIAKGVFLYIEGFVFDVVGVPVENAVVKIWQTNHFGYYNHLVVDKEDFSKYDTDFEGTGTCVTDNNGHYSFFTIIPGYYDNRTSHINFIVEHENFERLETMMFFSLNPRNLIDKIYKSMNHKNRYLTSCNLKDYEPGNPKYGKKCNFNLRLNGIHRNKRF